MLIIKRLEILLHELNQSELFLTYRANPELPLEGMNEKYREELKKWSEKAFEAVMGEDNGDIEAK